ncbi:MAG: hypothetical protein GOV00_04290 [Candidatus Altiarchaeota archaeon]|nr:hypothetical protein [Candidatus Altiarchaeota archaeon]
MEDKPILKTLYDSFRSHEEPSAQALSDFNEFLVQAEPLKVSRKSKKEMTNFNATHYGRSPGKIAETYSNMIGLSKNGNTKLKVETGLISNKTIKFKSKDAENPEVQLGKYQEFIDMSHKALWDSENNYTIESILGGVFLTAFTSLIYAAYFFK